MQTKIDKCNDCSAKRKYKKAFTDLGELTLECLEFQGMLFGDIDESSDEIKKVMKEYDVKLNEILHDISKIYKMHGERKPSVEIYRPLVYNLQCDDYTREVHSRLKHIFR